MEIKYICLLMIAFAIYIILIIIKIFNRKIFNFILFIFLSALCFKGIGLVITSIGYAFSFYEVLPFALALLLYPLLGSPDRKINKSKSFKLLTVKGDDIYFEYPFDNFLVYGGAGSGKTKSIGKPLMEQFIRNGFAGFIYDYKDWDYTQTAYNIINKMKLEGKEYTCSFHYVSFTDLNKTDRFNPLHPSVITSEALLFQLMDDILGSNLVGKMEKDEWYKGALGVLKGVAYRIWDQHRDMCTLPHILNTVMLANSKQLMCFLGQDSMCRMLAGAFIAADGSERTQASYLSSLNNYIADIATNKNVCYILTGDDFKFDLIDPNNPKLFAVCNNFALENVISPIISMLMSISSRKFEFGNRVKFVYLLDEMTTFRVRDFQNLPSVLREYMAAFVIMSQSGAKIEKTYSKLDRSSIESNCANMFLGRTKDVEALKYYPLFFGKEEKEKKSKSSGNSNSGHNSSVTLSTQKEEVYEAKIFSELEPGEFIGTAGHSNKTSFRLKLKQFSLHEELLPDKRIVTEKEINACYNKVINDVLTYILCEN